MGKVPLSIGAAGGGMVWRITGGVGAIDGVGLGTGGVSPAIVGAGVMYGTGVAAPEVAASELQAASGSVSSAAMTNRFTIGSYRRALRRCNGMS
jgi:hypothetical protein